LVKGTIECAGLGVGALRKVAGVIGIITTGNAERLFPFGSMERNARMSMSLECKLAARTPNSRGFKAGLTTRARQHNLQ
jgi:hypothetical protein